jgi:hypothetical protein
MTWRWLWREFTWGLPWTAMLLFMPFVFALILYGMSKHGDAIIDCEKRKCPAGGYARMVEVGAHEQCICVQSPLR